MSNRYEAEGKIHAIMDTQEINDRFRKREFVLEILDGNYAQHVKFQTVQDKCELLDSVEVGQEVKIAFNLKGREYTRRADGSTDYFVNLECWRIEAPGALDAPGNQDTGPQPEDIPDDDYGDVPF